MTLAQVITLTITRLTIDLDSSTDTTDNELMATAVSQAAKEWTRDTLCLWSWESAITLSNGVDEYDLLNSSICADLIFAPRGVHVNGKWLDELAPQDLFPGSEYDNYASLDSTTYPSYWTKRAPSHIKLIQPPNTTTAAALDNFVIGWREHPTYTYASHSGTQMLGPSTYHQFIADKAALNLAVGYIGSELGFTRYALIQDRYDKHANALEKQNKAEYSPRKVHRGAGSSRLYFGQ